MCKMDLLTTVQELQMQDALVRDGWPAALAEQVVRQVSHQVDASHDGVWGQLNYVLNTLRVEKTITVLQAMQVRQYITELENKRQLRPDLLDRRRGRSAAEEAHVYAPEGRHGRFHGFAAEDHGRFHGSAAEARHRKAASGAADMKQGMQNLYLVTAFNGDNFATCSGAGQAATAHLMSPH